LANPQKENGHTALANEIWDALAKYRLSGEEWQCLIVIFRKTYGWGKKEDSISLSQFAKLTGMKRQNVARALKKLSSKKMIGVIKNDDRCVLKYRFDKDFEKWSPVIKKDYCNQNRLHPVIKTDDKSVIKNDAYKRKKETLTKERYTPSENSKALTLLFLGTLSSEFQEKFKDQEKWQICFDKLLGEFDSDRLKVLVLFYRRDNFWVKNFMSPLKLLSKNKEGIRYIDYFMERMSNNGNNGGGKFYESPWEKKHKYDADEDDNDWTPEEEKERLLKLISEYETEIKNISPEGTKRLEHWRERLEILGGSK
jgi:phage replication O-like protein O